MSVPPTKEQALVQLAIRGDKEAFSVLMSKYQNRITNAVSRYATSRSELLDISQESFLKAYQSIADFRGESSFYTWLYRIAMNTAKNNLNARKMRFIDLDINTLDGFKNMDSRAIPFSEPEDVLIKEAAEDVMAEIVKALPEKLKIPFLLFENEGHTYIEIAHIMNCPIGTVRSRLYRARKRLKIQNLHH